MSVASLNKDSARALIKRVIETGDLAPLRPHIAAMMTEGYKDALMVSAISGDAPDDFDLFMAMCGGKGYISHEEILTFCNAKVDAEHAAERASV